MHLGETTIANKFVLIEYISVYLECNIITIKNNNSHIKCNMISAVCKATYKTL